MSFDFLDKHTISSKNFTTQTKFLVPDFIPKQHIVTYWADGGTGKSTLTYAVITYIQTHYKMKMVTIIDIDNPMDELRTKKVDTLLIERYKNLKFIHGSVLNKTPLDVVDELVNHATTDFYKDCLIVFDSARDFVDVNNDRQVQAFMEQAKKLRTAGATIIILLHGNKDARNYQGSNHFLNSCDCLSQVRRGTSKDESKFSFVIDTSKGRAGAKSCAFSVNTENYHLEQIPYDIAVLSRHDADFIEKVTQILKDNPDGINQKNLLEAIGLAEDNKAGRETLSKFNGKYWKIVKGLKNANFYHLITEDTVHTEQTGAEHD